MSEKTIDQAKLAEFMSAGWSYRSGGGVTVVSGGNDALKDVNTGKEYALYVENEKLTMSEVTNE